jgi:hypothetical protein
MDEPLGRAEIEGHPGRDERHSGGWRAAKHIVSKARLLTWIADTYDVLESHFKAALADWLSTRAADAAE